MSLGLASHRAACQQRKKFGGTPKQRVRRKYPHAELVKDGWDERAGISGCFDFAIFSHAAPRGHFIAEGPTPQAAWDEAARKLRVR